MNLYRSLLRQSVYHQAKIEKSVNSYIQHYLDQKCQKNINFCDKRPLAAVFAGSLTNEEKLRLCARALSDASHAMIALTVLRTFRKRWKMTVFSLSMRGRECSQFICVP